MKLPCRKRGAVLTALGVATVATAHAGAKPAVGQPDALANNGGYLTFFLDNDLFSGSDSNYTNGARISYVTEARPLLNIPLVQKNLELLSGGNGGARWMRGIWGFGNPDEVEYSYGFALTQLMFTPETLDTASAPPGEHPYAGWLGVGFSLHARDARTLNSVEISFGVTGKYAFAKEAQDLVHDFYGIEKFEGWDSQIPQEVTVNVDFNQRRRWTLLDDAGLPYGLEVDGFHETGYSIGNFCTGAHAGALVRVGWNLPVEFSDPRLTTSAHTQKLYSDESVNARRWSVYALAGVRVSGVLHDITLDGPVFRDFDTGVERKPWVGEFYAGFGVRYRGWELGYVHTYRSKRFKSQADQQVFGSVSLRTRF